MDLFNADTYERFMARIEDLRQLEEERRLAEADAQDTHEHEWERREALTAYRAWSEMPPVYAWVCRVCGESGYAV